MPPVAKIVDAMRKNQKNVRFSDCLKVCGYYFERFGEMRTNGSHHIFQTPWEDDPRINLQNRKGLVAPYQVRQVLKAIERLEGGHRV